MKTLQNNILNDWHWLHCKLNTYFRVALGGCIIPSDSGHKEAIVCINLITESFQTLFELDGCLCYAHINPDCINQYYKVVVVLAIFCQCWTQLENFVTTPTLLHWQWVAMKSFDFHYLWIGSVRYEICKNGRIGDNVPQCIVMEWGWSFTNQHWANFSVVFMHEYQKH